MRPSPHSAAKSVAAFRDGNHGQSVAYAGREFEVTVLVCVRPPPASKTRVVAA